MTDNASAKEHGRQRNPEVVAAIEDPELEGTRQPAAGWADRPLDLDFSERSSGSSRES